LFLLVVFVLFLSIAEIERIVQGPGGENNSNVPYSYSIMIHGEPVTFCNQKFRELFLEDSPEVDELDCFNSQRLYAPLLWGKTLSPEDHATFFAAVAKASYSKQAESCDTSLVVKVNFLSPYY